MSTGKSLRRDPAQSTRHARRSVTLAFIVNGALIGSILPRYPEAKRAFDLGETAFGLTVVLVAFGAMMAAHTPGVFLRRWGSARVVPAGSAAVALVLAGCGLAISLAQASGTTQWVWLFLPLLAAAGFGDAVADTAQNAQGLRVQRAVGRPILTMMHAGWSVGAAVGSAVAAVTLFFGVPAWLHLTLTGGVLTLLAHRVAGGFLPDRDDRQEADAEAAPPATRPWAVFVLVWAPVAVAIAGFAVEEAGNNWTPLYLNTERGLDLGAAGLGASVVLGFQFVGRLLGDRIIARVGPQRAVQAGLGAVVAGLALAFSAGGAPLIFTFIGLAMAGFGCAVTVPVAFAMADAVQGLAPQTGLAVVGFLMRVGSVGMSPLVGVLAGWQGLTAAMYVFVLLGLLGLVATLWLRQPGIGGATPDRAGAGQGI